MIASHAYSDEMLTTLEKGETARIGDFALTFKGLSERMENGNGIVAADMDISYKGKSAGTVRPEKIFYSTWPEPSSEVAIKTVASQDLYVVLSTWENQAKRRSS